jgi:hypothetical protein
MNRQLSLVLALVAALLAACQKQEAAPPADTTAPAATTEPATPPPAETTAPATTDTTAPATDTTAPPADPTAATTDTTAPAASPAPIGVPECDDYLTKYEACLAAHVPAESRAALQQSLDATRAGWQQAVASGGKDSLAAACTQMRESARASLQAYGCTDF